MVEASGQTTNGTNIDGFLNMLVAARDARVYCFVHAASSLPMAGFQPCPRKGGAC
ncbi:MAG: hypothetical protein KA204_01705 [Chromatiaceae bacterium]|nr:hypothetical protein [Chromatiaceae bacterium]MBP6733802.1 hypothetical protein [Chromatiaceae bacterium]MBP6806756.1 hypothetical protein [Chromatiaceae bacterium]MBP8288440.1 hypothetical protein [Chromatiaceae bacterium]MBP9602679.1 hypothetical protein [Chromatiaceae bacterium]